MPGLALATCRILACLVLRVTSRHLHWPEAGQAAAAPQGVRPCRRENRRTTPSRNNRRPRLHPGYALRPVDAGCQKEIFGLGQGQGQGQRQRFRRRICHPNELRAGVLVHPRGAHALPPIILNAVRRCAIVTGRSPANSVADRAAVAMPRK